MELDISVLDRQNDLKFSIHRYTIIINRCTNFREDCKKARFGMNYLHVCFDFISDYRNYIPL